MTSKRENADRQFARLTRDEKDERTTSKSRTITDSDKVAHDLKTARLKKQREAKEAGDIDDMLKEETGEMTHIDAEKMTDEALKGYDEMMAECVVKVEKFAGLATAIWSDVLKELDRRGKVKLISGSYDDLGNALIHRVE